METALSQAQVAYSAYAQACIQVSNLVAQGSPQPATNNAIAVAAAAQTTLFGTQAAITAAYTACGC